MTWPTTKEFKTQEIRTLSTHLSLQHRYSKYQSLTLNTRQTALPPDALELTKIERELTEDILTLFDDKGLSQEQALSLLGQVSVLLELVKRGMAQRAAGVGPQ